MQIGGDHLDFITKLQRTAHGVHSIWVMFDRLTRSACFIPIVEGISPEKLTDIYIRVVVVGYGVPVSVVLD